VVNSYKETPLHIACTNADIPTILQLVNHNANLFLQDSHEKMPLYNLSIKCNVTHNSVIKIKVTDHILSPPKKSWGFDMSRYFNSNLLSDVTFRVQGSCFFGHRIILCSQSPAFRSLLEGDWKDSSNKEIDIFDIPPIAFKVIILNFSRNSFFQHMLEYCYTGEARLPREDVTLGLQLVAAADRFLLEDLKRNCEYLLHTKITLENAFEVYTAAGYHNAPGLRSMAARFILQNYSEIEFADVDRAIVKNIISLL
jgi:hypothetical protein